MIQPLLHKLSNFADLSDEEKAALNNAAQESISFEKGEDIIVEGEKPDHIHLIEEGWACRYKLLERGDQHTMAFLLPGDMCDIHITILDEMDHSIRALTPVKLTRISAQEMNSIFENFPRLTRALFWSTLVDEAILREWLVSAGSRIADARLAHVFCELLLRSRAAGLTRDNSFELPLTQEALGEAMGLTNVHINRVVQQMRKDGLLEFEKKRLIICDWEKMKAFSGFKPNYLHYQHQNIEP
ncbi:Crp/Fnr family transcriptional regulator [Halomonas korlensis]|uniref:cAMP-binding domain of CRP or a regulatory subunit of cAMP-dependent protein kinases n=1 Tax=Halomonas korlensis TaxID=463301 RepID=A0A1I7KDB5_9GAMM|nr:Crp/Fnr family transcriptional regulator [Halomonas korlensis]SFU95356.1 cAMP-binding domain of CRP or a regulatory subunit of cAMP-dependent protein kinases [Halomonas korlensis]